MIKPTKNVWMLTITALMIAGCNNQSATSVTQPPVSQTPPPSASTVSPLPGASTSLTPAPTMTAKPAATTTPKASPTSPGNSAGKPDHIQVVAQPDSITALVNKQFKLPENYEPKDLVYPDVPFTFEEKVEKRMLRKEAASALEEMFKVAAMDGVSLAGVSAYRSHATQKALFNRYVKQDGEEKARTYSAVPGHSEHETGLAIDISGSNGKCAAQDCFAGTKEAIWLEEHASEYGFIVRYPKGKEAITGYQYEPWHLRYVGRKVAEEIAGKGLTMEQYYNAVPVNQ